MYRDRHEPCDAWRGAAQVCIKRPIPLRHRGRAEQVARLVGLLFEADIVYLIGKPIYLHGTHGINRR